MPSVILFIFFQGAGAVYTGLQGSSVLKRCLVTNNKVGATSNAYKLESTTTTFKIINSDPSSQTDAITGGDAASCYSNITTDILPNMCTSWKLVANAMTTGTRASTEKSPYGVYRLTNSPDISTSTNNLYVQDKFWSVSSTENFATISHWFTNGVTETTYPKCSLTENSWTDMWSVSSAKNCASGGHTNIVGGHNSGSGGKTLTSLAFYIHFILKCYRSHFKLF